MALGKSLAYATMFSMLLFWPASAQKKTDRPYAKEITLPQTSMPKTASQSTSEVALELAAPTPKETRVISKYFEAGATNLRDTATVTHRGIVLSALRYFNLKFENGDHKILSIGLLNDGPSITTTLRDEDGDDPYTVSAGFVAIESLLKQTRYQTISATQCEVRCTIRIEGLGRHETALLAGFQFNRERADANLRAISVELLPDRGVANVAFFDDRGPDYSDFMPLPFYDAIETIEGTTQETRYYDAYVQVLIVPKKIVRGVTRVIGASGQEANFPEDRALIDYIDNDGGAYALMGFGLSFRDEDHFIEQVAINHNDRPRVRFQDGNPDDNITWYYDVAAIEREIMWP